MSQCLVPTVLPCLRRLLTAHADESVPDRDLLRRFVEEQDEAAFELVLWRHSGMVLDACRRIVRDLHEAEDAFQATFLALARRAGTIRERDAVAGWLHRVACRAAWTVRARGQRRRVLEQPIGADIVGPEPDPAQLAITRELGRMLDLEVNRLAARYRLPFILCHLQGKTNAEAARELGCAVGTVESRLVRARARLRRRLAGRGWLVSAGGALMLLDQAAEAARASTALLARTRQAALAFVGGAGQTPGVLTPTITTVAEGVLRAMFLSKLKTAMLLAACLLLMTSGLGLLCRAARAGAPVDDGQTRAAQQAPASQASVKQPAPISEWCTIEKLDLAAGKIKVKVQTYYAMADGSLRLAPQISANWVGLAGQPSHPHNQPTAALLINAGQCTNCHQFPVTSNLDLGQVHSTANTIATWQGVYQPYIGNWNHWGSNVTAWPITSDVEHPLAPEVRVIIDEKEARLKDLPAKLYVELTLDAQKRVTQIKATGSTLDDCRVDALDPVKHSLTVVHQNKPKRYDLATQVGVVINGQATSAAELRPDMPVQIRLSALRPTVLRVEASGPTVECILRAVDAEHGALTVSLRKEHLTVPNIRVVDGAPVKLAGHAARLVDLRSRLGKPIRLRMDADPEQNRAVAVQAD